MKKGPEDIVNRLKCWWDNSEERCGESHVYCRDCSLRVPGYSMNDAVKDAIAYIYRLEFKCGEDKKEIEALKAEIEANDERFFSGIHTVRGEAQPKWISVEEQPPEYCVKVWVAIPTYDGWKISTGERYKNNAWLIGDIRAASGEPPTHWMPLPEPPKEEK